MCSTQEYHDHEGAERSAPDVAVAEPGGRPQPDLVHVCRQGAVLHPTSPFTTRLYDCLVLRSYSWIVPFHSSEG